MPDLTGRLYIYPDHDSVSQDAAEAVAAWVRGNPARPLGLATGKTMIPFYQALADIYQQDKLAPGGQRLSFGQTPCFNLDDYRLTRNWSNSYSRFMEQHFYRHVDCPNKLRFMPYARPGVESLIAERCGEYEAKIREHGGIGLQLLGLGPLECEEELAPIQGGHLGFNEAGSDPHSRTRLVQLAAATRRAAVKEFGSLDRVPMQAVTMGLGTIMEAERIMILVTGAAKARIVRYALENEPTPDITATILHTHPNVRWCLDEAAASQLPPTIMLQARRCSGNELLGGGVSARKLATFGPA